MIATEEALTDAVLEACDRIDLQILSASTKARVKYVRQVRLMAEIGNFAGIITITQHAAERRIISPFEHARLITWALESGSLKEDA